MLCLDQILSINVTLLFGDHGDECLRAGRVRVSDIDDAKIQHRPEWRTWITKVQEVCLPSRYASPGVSLRPIILDNPQTGAHIFKSIKKKQIPLRFLRVDGFQKKFESPEIIH